MKALEEKIIRFIYAILAKRKKHGYHFTPNAAWRKMVLSFTCVCLLIIAFDGYFFYKLSLGELFATPHGPASTNALTLNRAQLEQINTFYDAAEEKFTTGSSTTVPTIDPSS